MVNSVIQIFWKVDFWGRKGIENQSDAGNSFNTISENKGIIFVGAGFSGTVKIPAC